MSESINLPRHGGPESKPKRPSIAEVGKQVLVDILDTVKNESKSGWQETFKQITGRPPTDGK